MYMLILIWELVVHELLGIDKEIEIIQLVVSYVNNCYFSLDSPPPKRTNYWQTLCLVAEGFVSTFLGAYAKLWKETISFIISVCMGWNSIVGIATCYRLDGLGIESQWGRYFRTHPDWPWDQPSLLGSGYQVFPWDKVAGSLCWPPAPI
jgi:hypothetical protein